MDERPTRLMMLLAACAGLLAARAEMINVLTLGAKNDGSADVSAIVNANTARGALLFPAGVYTFDDEGRMVLNGLYEQGGELWYYENGVKTPKGLVKIGDDYYYIKPNGAAVRGADYYVTKTNGL